MSHTLIKSKLDQAAAAFRQVVPAGEPFVHRVERGQVFRILDLEGNQVIKGLPDEFLRRLKEKNGVSEEFIQCEMHNPFVNICAQPFCIILIIKNVINHG